MVTQKPEQSVIDIVDTLLHKALQQGVSDIHLESTEQGLRVRFRLDGVLHDQEPLDVQLMPEVISRVKVLAHIDIAQKRIPQDGKFQLYWQDRTIDVRVSTFPTLFGQKIVMRMLDPVKHIGVMQLGMSLQMLDHFLAMLQRPQGFFLVTGPTGSGKTTTLYAGLLHINTHMKNIITLEDPIEYHVKGITQGHIHPEAGFTFEKGMRALLRQDPDVIMVGEIRDQQTAHIAIQAAMTGHLVLSTLHTNDAASAVVRLMDIGIDPFLINASLSGILAQRLARLLCVGCKRERALHEDERMLCQKYGKHLTKMYEAVGCESCFQLGYKGRIGIFEQLIMTDNLRELMHGNASLDAIRSQACKEGMVTLFDDGFQKVSQGLISLSELLRVV